MCEVRLPGGMNENSHIKVSRCVVAMVTAINHATLKVMFWAKILSFKSKNKLVWFSGECEPTEIKIPQGEASFLSFLKLDVKDFYKLAKIDRWTRLPFGPFHNPPKQAKPFYQFLPKYSFPRNQISIRLYTDTKNSKYHKIFLGKTILWQWLFSTFEENLNECLKWPFIRFSLHEFG